MIEIISEKSNLPLNQKPDCESLIFLTLFDSFLSLLYQFINFACSFHDVQIFISFLQDRVAGLFLFAGPSILIRPVKNGKASNSSDS